MVIFLFKIVYLLLRSKDYERKSFLAGKTKDALAQRITDLFQIYVQKYGESSFGGGMFGNKNEYYSKTVANYNKADLKEKFTLGYFIHNSNCYE